MYKRQDIDHAEDRHKFSAMLDELGIDQPEWSELTTIEAVSYTHLIYD